MKKFLTLIIIAAIATTASSQVSVDVLTGANYENDVYYSFENGSVKTVTRADWDIAFITYQFSVSILANNGGGVELYTYPLNDTLGWNSLDTNGMHWYPMYNSNETWDDGAFNQNVTAGAQYDYGWGQYNSTSHHITGDSLFIIKTANGNYKKLWIVEKDAPANTWSFRFADLDGANEQSVVLDADNYDTKNFVGYSLDNNQVVDMEPASSDWDLLFTRYYDKSIPYYVSGVLSNEYYVLLQEVQQSGLDQATFEDYDDYNFVSTITEVGSDWKEFNMTNFTYDILDDVVYFAKRFDGTDTTYWKFYFTGFEGSSTGKYSFVQKKLKETSALEENVSVFFEIYPNPATDYIHLVYDLNGPAEIDIIDANGRVVDHSAYTFNGFSNYKMDVSRLDPGLYLMQLTTGKGTSLHKFIKK